MDEALAAKAELRERRRAARRARPQEERDRVGRAIADLVGAIPEYARATCVTAYASFGTEPPTGALLARLRADGKRVLLPAVHEDGTLGWLEYTGPDSLALTERGIPEPVGPEVGTGAAVLLEAGVELMLVPALSVDEAGARIGKGGGFYDGVLAELPSDHPLRVAVVHSDDLLPAGDVPSGPHDQRVHAVLTEDGYRRL